MSGTSTGEPSWKWRRILIYITVAACFADIYLLIDAKDTALNGIIAQGSFWTLVAIVMTYTGAATVQDIIAIWTMRTARPYAEQPLEPVAPAPLPDPAPVVVVQQPAGGEQ